MCIEFNDMYTSVPVVIHALGCALYQPGLQPSFQISFFNEVLRCVVAKGKLTLSDMSASLIRAASHTPRAMRTICWPGYST